MKWFGHQPLSPDPETRANQCAEYLMRSGDLPEREATALILLELVQTYAFSKNTYRKIVRTGIPQVVFGLAMFGNPTAIDTVIENCDDQNVLNNVLNNKSLEKRHLEMIDELIDNSPKGMINKAILERLKRELGC